MTEEGFLGAVQQALGEEAYGVAAGAGLAERLTAGVAAVRQRFGEAPPPGEEFARYLAARLALQGSLHEAARRLCFEELFLAWWAGTGDQRGILAFEALFESDIARLVERFHRLPAEELRQRLRAKLFTGTGEAGPRIHDYAGMGPLQGWLRVTAARTFVDAERAELPA